MYKQLTLTQRYAISAMRQNGFSLQAIADELSHIEEEDAQIKGRDPSGKEAQRLHDCIKFRNHKAFAKALGCTVYFADSYCSGQKGAVENANKIFREYFPKGTNFKTVTQKELDKVQYQINE